MEPFEEQEGDQGCPKLDQEGVEAGADEGFDFQVLLQGLEKDLYLPAILVDGGDGRGGEFEMTCQENNLPIVVLVPDDDPPQAVRTYLDGFGSG